MAPRRVGEVVREAGGMHQQSYRKSGDLDFRPSVTNWLHSCNRVVSCWRNGLRATRVAVASRHRRVALARVAIVCRCAKEISVMLRPVAELLLTLAEPTRLRIVNCLSAAPLFVSDLAAILELPHATEIGRASCRERVYVWALG